MGKRFFAAFVAVCVVLLTNSSAQTINATLGGTVSDTSGALIPGVSITATNTQTGIVTTVISNDAGAYQFASLQTGIYTVRAELPGFQVQTRSQVTLGVSQQVRLNFTLEVGTVAQSVEVSVAADTLIATTSASVGAVLPEYKVRDLPLASRNVIDLVATTAGTGGGQNFAGARVGSVNVTRDGVPTVDGRFDTGVFGSTYVSPDLVEEVRIIVAPADAETGRGSGQVQMATRSGTNQFRGSLFWQNRNSAPNANSWLNNFNGVGKDYKNANQYGGRLGGPIVKNKTFFFFLFEGQRYVAKSYFTGNVLTPEARQGNFRFFPGVQNGNVFSNNPVVDVFGNPVTPQGATGPLQTVSVFGRDPLRPGMDTSGWIRKLIARMPAANDFTIGDGLNTAGHRWVRRVRGTDNDNGDGQDTNRDQYNFRIDQNFNSSHKLSFSGTWEKNTAMTPQAGISAWPGGYDGTVLRKPSFYSAALVSTVSPTIVNEFRFGTRRNYSYSWAPFHRPDEVGDATRAELPVVNGQAFFPTGGLFSDNIITTFFGNTRGSTSPLYSYTDTLSWTQGKHAFKAGGEVRLTSSSGFNGPENTEFLFPTVGIGAGSNPVTGITNIPNIGANSGGAQNLLITLAGSVSNVSQSYGIQRPADQQFTLPVRVRDHHQNEWSAFFKDDWKVRSDLTLNLGLRYDKYGVPYEQNGMHALPVGGAAGMFGISGTSFADMWQPGRMTGALTTVQLVGKNSPNADIPWHKNDWNNFAPAIGLSWSVPWFGRDKTVLRAGYGVNYQGAQAVGFDVNQRSGNNPGFSYTQNLTSLGLAANYYNLSNLPLPVPDPPASAKPFDLVISGDNFPRTRTLFGFDDNRVNPYIQNWNLELQRELASNLTLEVRYIGSKGTKLWGGFNLNESNIYETGILAAFNTTRAGGDAPLFDQMLRGLNLGLGTINGTTVTGSASLRQNTGSRGFIANGDPEGLANFLNTSTTVTGRAGGLLRNSGLFAENFITVNPQFASVTLDGNPDNSTYHSLNTQVTRRLSHGFTNQTSYTWSRTLGTAGFFTLRDRSAKALAGFHRTHEIRSNGTFEFPFGPNRPFLQSGPSFVTRLVELWQLGAIFSWTSGAPLSLSAASGEMPIILGNFPRSIGRITPAVSGATYFTDLRQIDDPSRASITTLQGLQNQFSNRAITDAQGNLILVNPAPGTRGNLGRAWIEGPSRIGMDLNVVKRVRIDERKQLEFRVDAVNVLNTPQWGNPNTNINSTSFGRLTAIEDSTARTARLAVTGARRFTINARLNF